MNNNIIQVLGIAIGFFSLVFLEKIIYILKLKRYKYLIKKRNPELLELIDIGHHVIKCKFCNHVLHYIYTSDAKKVFKNPMGLINEIIFHRTFSITKDCCELENKTRITCKLKQKHK